MPLPSRRVEAGAQLSNGYLADFDFTPGTSPEGEAYDATQSNIRGNHIALVEAGRCGESCRISDGLVPDCGCGGALTTVTVDGVAFEVAATSSEAIEQLRRQIEANDGTIAALAAQIPDEHALDVLVADRARVMERARATLGAGFELHGLSTKAIRRAVVSRLLGAVSARAATPMSPPPSTRSARSNRPAIPSPPISPPATGPARRDVRRQRDHFLTHAWKGDTQGDL